MKRQSNINIFQVSVGLFFFVLAIFLLATAIVQTGKKSAFPYSNAVYLPASGVPPLLSASSLLPYGILMVERGNDRGFQQILATVLKYEGNSYVRRDGFQSAKFGILQSTARQLRYRGNIKYMTGPQAKAIYRKIWDKSGAASLPYPLSLVHFDTYVNSPAAAMKLLNLSGGNTGKYLEMRARRYARLAQLRPSRYGRHMKGWMNRIADLRNITAGHTAPDYSSGMLSMTMAGMRSSNLAEKFVEVATGHAPAYTKSGRANGINGDKPAGMRCIAKAIVTSPRGYIRGDITNADG